MKKTIFWLLLSAVCYSTFTFANVEQISVLPTEWSMETEKISIPSYGNTNVKYSYDQKELASLYKKDSSLIEVVCQSEDVFKNLWVNAKDIKINSIGFSKNNLDITVDVKNCSLYANRSAWSQAQQQGTSDAKALAAAQVFVDSVLGSQGIVSVPSLWKPMILMRENGGAAYPMLRESTMNNDSALSGIDLVSTSSGEKIDVQYNSISVLYPYLVWDAAIYNNYGGGKMWVVVTVDGDGVSYVSIPLLAFKWVAKTAEKNTFEWVKKFIDQGGNSPYYGSNGNTTTVALDKPERVLVYFNYYELMSNVSRGFISDWVRLGSSVKQYDWSLQNYEMIVSDFIIGNNNNPVLFDMSASVESTTKTKKTAGLKRRIPVKKK